ncbi:hypothetical protein ABIF26_009566 [Bradyrhizobium elkanii]|uniref:hypothetical protein n=1 Tax=Bradyrhizobium elkanii TaxID=29448 RepID=UPI003517C33F
MDEKDISLRAQLMAIEHLLTTLYAEMHVRKGRNLHDAKARHQAILEVARQETFPTRQPGLSDHVAGEYEIELERLLRAVEQRLAAAQPQ